MWYDDPWQHHIRNRCVYDITCNNSNKKQKKAIMFRSTSYLDPPAIMFKSTNNLDRQGLWRAMDEVDGMSIGLGGMALTPMVSGDEDKDGLKTHRKAKQCRKRMLVQPQYKW